MLDVVEHIGRGLIDGRGPRAGSGVRLGARMDREGVEAWFAVSGHVLFLAIGVVDA